jgi:ATP-binding cassette subfamily D (ALD) protein 3
MITKPRSVGDGSSGGSGGGGGDLSETLNSSVFYLPQKPYNVLGTLQDQLTYPEQSTERTAQLSRPELHNLLAQVDLQYLLDRPGVLTDETNWEEAISLGEKQRLAIARLLFHRPQFAILDECTR